MRYLVAVAAVLCLAACGGGTSATTQPHRATCPRTARALAKLNADIAAIRHAARTTPENSPQINAATDRFLLHVATAPISNLKRNRMIDHAMGALSGQCEQCFQGLEAARPIPSIRLGGNTACR
ncbi:MAG TPA: hypothetical protein VFA56_06000 [Gaiellaceae bacterium]|nr:hypothetical protein [Gaiellaceae bacterium]